MTTWDYRIVADGERFYVTDVYYDDGQPNDYGEPHTILESNDLGELAWTINKVVGALTRPLLRVQDGALIAVEQL